MRAVLVLPLCFLLTPAAAQDYSLRDGDIRMSRAELIGFLPRRIIRFHDGGASEYYADNRYTYTYEGGGTAYGYWRVETDGEVCVDFVTGFGRCDLYVRDGARVTLLTAGGDRFPVTAESLAPLPD